MANQIRIRRGLKKDLPALAVGEQALCTDTGEVYIGTAAGNKLVNIGPVYDVIIRTQTEFEALYNSSNWLGATSVAFVGNGGTLKFTRATTGLKVPQMVKRIDGFNSATIEITGFVYNDTTNKAALWYETLPTTTDYCISGLIVNCTALSGNYGITCYGFYNCTQLTRCTSDISFSGNGSYANFGGCFYNCTRITECICNISTKYSNTYGFRDCTQLTDCTATAIGSNTSNYCFHACTQLTDCTGNCAGSGFTTSDSATGFRDCTQLTDCTGNGNAIGTGTGNGFTGCTQLTNCTGGGTATGTGAGRGFSGCTQLTNCTGNGNGGSSNSHGFYNCKHTNGCRESTTLSTTGIWGGTNTFIDTESCQMTR